MLAQGQEVSIFSSISSSLFVFFKENKQNTLISLELEVFEDWRFVLILL